VRVLKVVGFAERRGSADAARALCETLEPAPNHPVQRPLLPPGAREAGTGRPTKRERRAIERLRQGDDKSE
jgi:ribosome-associated heat shock protein Hsp15